MGERYAKILTFGRVCGEGDTECLGRLERPTVRLDKLADDGALAVVRVERLDVGKDGRDTLGERIREVFARLDPEFVAWESRVSPTLARGSDEAHQRRGRERGGGRRGNGENLR